MAAGDLPDWGRDDYPRCSSKYCQRCAEFPCKWCGALYCDLCIDLHEEEGCFVKQQEEANDRIE